MKDKEMEVNIKDSAVNKADVPGNTNRNSKNRKQRNRNKGRDKFASSKNSKPGSLRGAEVGIFTKSKDNDPSWYLHLYENAQDVAKLPFNQVQGLTQTAITAPSNGFPTGMTNTSSPQVTNGTGIMRIILRPSLGRCDTPQDPINVAGQQLYSEIRKANSGAKNYDPTDVTMLVVAMTSAYTIYEWLLRAYRVIGNYNSTNRYYPQVLLQAMGFRYSMLETHLADFRSILDLFAYRLGSINIPNVMDYISRQKWLYQNVYKDSDTDRAQLMFFNPEGYYQWVEGAENEPTYLKFVQITPQNSFEDIQKLIDNIMTPLLGSQDVGLISGDIAKAFSESDMVKFESASNAPELDFVYSPEVLSQIENAVSFGKTNFVDQDTINWNITVNNNNLASGPFLQQSHPVTSPQPYTFGAINKPLLNMHKTDPDPGEIMVATRLMAKCTTYQLGTLPSGGKYDLLDICGTEVVSETRIYTINPDGTVHTMALPSHNLTDNDLPAWLGMLSHFDWHPTSYVWKLITNSDTARWNLESVVVDWDNYRYTDSEELDNLHQIAIMSLFDVKSFNMNLTK